MKISSFAVYLLSVTTAPLSTHAFATGIPGKKVLHSNGVVLHSTTEEAPVTETSLAADPTKNPFLQQDDLPKFKSLEPKYITPAMDVLIEKLEQEFTELETDLSSPKNDVDYEALVPKLERIESQLEYAWGVTGHLNGVKNGEELRLAYEENQPKVVQAVTKLSQSKAVYDALVSIENQWKKDDEKNGDDFELLQKQRTVANSLRGMTLSGVGLEGEEKKRYNELKLRLADLSNKFSNNVLDATKEFSVTVTDASKLEGVPESAKAMWANAHAMYVQSQKGNKANDKDTETITPESGPWRITLDMPSYIASLSHIPDRELRKEIYFGHITKASEKHGEKSNIPLIYEILKIKAEMATLLGYENYAQVSLSSKMAPSVAAVDELTDLIAKQAIPAAKRELEAVTNYARAHGGEEYSEKNMPKLEPWDITFWSERLKESKYELTQEELRPYFALPAVLDGMFGLVKRIFNIDVRKAEDGEVEVWHPDVQFFKVYDVDTEEHIASFYLDPYSRPEDKRGGAWMAVCVGKSAALQRNIPVAYLTCNGSPPIGDTPSLMTFSEVETLFHEFGHGLQHMLTKASEGSVAGINGVEWDAVELPSQFMENWCYDKATIYGFAKHYKTGEPLPEEMFTKLCKQKTYNAGMMACRQLYLGQLDMELHNNYDAEKGSTGEGESIFDVQKRVAAKYIPHSLPLEEDRFLCTFGHIFAGGYSAAYYSYKWAEVMSADAFAAFEEVGLDNEKEVKEVGMKFRETVLSLGGGVPPMEVFKRFRGREPNPEPLLRHNGLL